MLNDSPVLPFGSNTSFSGDRLMRRFLIACFAVASLSLVVGCQNKDQGSMSNTKSSEMKGMDECSHCAGVQHANAEGKCPMCQMPLTKSNAK
jgi:uncharacterized paraquat-inducible protein A